MPPHRSQILDDLRHRIARIEGRREKLDDAPEDGRDVRWSMGLCRVDDHLPSGGLPIGAVHECQGAEFGDGPAASAFALALLRRLPDRRGPGRRTVLWCQHRDEVREFGRPYGPGLRAAGLDPAELVLATVRREEDVLWALEEGVRAGVLAAALGTVTTAGLGHTRRLSLAAAETATPCLLLRWPGPSAITAAASRWRVSAVPAAPDRWDGHSPGASRWRVELNRCRGGRPGHWTVGFDDTTNRFHLAAPLADRQVGPQRAAAVLSLARAG